MATARRQLGYVSSLTTQTVFVEATPDTVECLVVGGGGTGGWGGGAVAGAGGGGGGIAEGSYSVSTGVTYTVTVGAGGTGDKLLRLSRVELQASQAQV
jgi:hypothetical protein